MRIVIRRENAKNDADWKLTSIQSETVDYIVRHEAVQKMRVGPSESACRS
jgi:hypothetical protein